MVEPALTDPVAVVNKAVIDYAALKRAQKVPFLGSGTPMSTSGDTLTKEQMALERLINRELLHKEAIAQAVTVTPNEVDAALTRLLRRLPGPRTYKTLLADLKMTEIQTALNQKVDFIRLADRYTPKDQIKNGGDRGYFTAGALDPDLEDRLFTMKIDEISDPIETEIAVLFVKIVDKQLEQLASFSAVKNEIKSYLLAKKRHTKMVQYIDQLKTNAHIERMLPDEAESETAVE